MANLVELNRVCLRYGESNEILRDISCSFARGSFTFIIGASGSGKSSLLKLIYLEAIATRGTVNLFGVDTLTIPRGKYFKYRRRLGVISDNLKLLDHITLFENIALPLRVMNSRLQDYKANILELLEWVGLEKRAFSYPNSLSSGEQKRAMLARALVLSPELIVVDEISGSVEHSAAQSIIAMLAEINSFGTTVIIATHDKRLFAGYEVPLIELSQGAIV